MLLLILHKKLFEKFPGSFAGQRNQQINKRAIDSFLHRWPSLAGWLVEIPSTLKVSEQTTEIEGTETGPVSILGTLSRGSVTLTQPWALHA